MKLAASVDLIQASVLLHPSRVTEDDIKGKLYAFQTHSTNLSLMEHCLFQRLRFQLLYWELRLIILPQQNN